VTFGVRRASSVPDAYLRAALDAMLDPYLLAFPLRDAGGRIADLVYVDANAAACRALGVGHDDLVDSCVRQTLPAALADDLVDAAARVIQEDGTLELSDQQYGVPARWFDVRIVKVADGVGVTWHEVTDQHEALDRLSRSEQRFRLLAENSSDFVYFADAEGRASWVAPTVTRSLGWQVDELLGTVISDLVHPDDWDVAAALREAATTGTEVVALSPGVAHPILTRLRQADGVFRWMSVTATCVHESGSPEHHVVVGMRDVDELIATQERAERGQRDDLTGLANRPHLLERMERILAEGRRSSDVHAVLYCDVDHFKEINDTFGHAVGDEVLRVIAGRIRASVRDDDLVARLGGDEFVVLLQAVRGPAEAEAVAEKIRAAMRQALIVDGVNLARSFSIGVAMVDPDSTPDRVLRDADAALYEAKEAGRDRTVTHRGRRLAG
jgi:diguanylate cyclase (GGDEF)-like protein/PAS domain S-box-containing protein